MDAILMLLLFGCIWVAVAVGVAPLIGRTISRKSQFESQDREQLGLLERQRAESRARVERAMARHNRGKSA